MNGDRLSQPATNFPALTDTNYRQDNLEFLHADRAESIYHESLLVFSHVLEHRTRHI